METVIKRLADELDMTPKAFVQEFCINFNHEWIVEDEQESDYTSFETVSDAENYINDCIFSGEDYVFVHNTKTGKKHSIVMHVKVLGVDDETNV